MAVWLARDEYSHDSRSNIISVTSLLKSTRQFVLSKRAANNGEIKVEDISGRLASRIGTSIHNSIEAAWTENHVQALTDLGYPNGAIRRVRINPEPSELEEGVIPLYFEKRSEKECKGWIVSGQFDLIYDGQVQDIKSTSVFTYINKTNDLKYSQQGSLYRWLNPSLITQDDMAIQFIFKDWSPNMAMSTPNYPPLPVLEYRVPLLSLSQSDAFVNAKLTEINRCMSLPESELPLCSDEDLWRRDPQFKYYAKSDAKRSTKNFTNLAEANSFLASKGCGEVREVKSEPTACRYCPVLDRCSQGQNFINSGELKL
jgi:hypothetical protein